MPADPLTLAKLQILNVSGARSSPISVIGFPNDESTELAPGEAITSLAGEEPVPRSEIIRPLPLKPPIKTALTGDPALRLSRAELEAVPPEDPVIVATVGHELRLSAFRDVARQAVESNKSLVIVARRSMRVARRRTA
jgi:hypothetical protein